jgi:hypothetical protein
LIGKIACGDFSANLWTMVLVTAAKDATFAGCLAPAQALKS